MEQNRTISLRERIRLNLVAAMENAGINQVQLAEKLNISKGTVNNWTRGNNSPDVDMVPKICEVLGISILALYSPTEFESPETANEIKKFPAPPAGSTGAKIDSINLYSILVDAGIVKPGEDLTDEDLHFLISIVDIISAWFNK